MHKTQTLNDFIFEHCNQSMDNARSAERYPPWKRSCSELKDVDFIHLGLLRCISQVDSGRHFLQTAEEVYGDRCQDSCRLKLNLCCLVFYHLYFLFFRIKMNNSYRFPVSYFATPAVRIF